MTPIDLMLDNDNELLLKVNVEGTRPGTSVCRLMLEGTDMQYGFKGNQTEDGEISVVIPPLKGFIKEGVYDTHLEVVVDDRIFIPLEMKLNFEKSVEVTAESVSRSKRSKPFASAVLLNSADASSQTKRKTLNEVISKRDEVKPEKKRNTTVINDKKLMEIIRTIKNEKKGKK